jgi:hypothetical protein
MHMLCQLREDRFDQRAVRIDHITLKRCLLFLVRALRRQNQDALALFQTPRSFLVDETLVCEDQTIIQVAHESFQEVDVMRSGVEQIKEIWNPSGCHTQPQLIAIVVPILAGAVAPVCLHKPTVAASTEEPADRHRDGVYDAHIFDINAQLGEQETTERVNVASHITPPDPQPGLARQWPQVTIEALCMSQDSCFTFQPSQIGQHYQLQDQTVTVVWWSSNPFLVSWAMLTEPLDFAEQNLASTLMQNRIGHDLAPFQTGCLSVDNPSMPRFDYGVKSFSSISPTFE